MSKAYSQWTAIMAMAKASFKALLRSPSALGFSIAFPLMFILLFGFMGNGPSTVTVAISKQSDTTNIFYSVIKTKIKSLKIIKDSTQAYYNSLLEKGSITAILDITPGKDTGKAMYNVHITSSNASVDKIGLLQAMLEAAQFNIDKAVYPNNKTYINKTSTVVEGRKFKEIDFILPGQLGFSLLSTGLFGVAFLLFSLKDTLVLKRYFATPVNKGSILIAEGLARVAYQVIVSSSILLLGKYVFGYQMVHGWLTFFELLVMCLIGVFLFMGFGFMISAFAKTLTTIPVLTNILGFPQLLLSGTFFPIEAFPFWLKPIAKILPLTHLNNCMRKIGFSGYHITDCGLEIGIIAIWTVVLYAIAIRFFKWE
jgi:ABC-2 type transport system permease protein